MSSPFRFLCRRVRERSLTFFSVDPEPAPEGSFIAETSFARAPINTRLPPVSPHRATTKPRLARKSREGGAAVPPRRSHDEDDLSDSGSLIIEEEEDPETKERRDKGRRKAKGLEKEPLEGLSAELQEALIVEDLLFVLMVGHAWLEHFSPPCRSRLMRFPFDGRESKVVMSNMIRLTLPRMSSKECRALNLSWTEVSVGLLLVSTDLVMSSAD